MNPLTTTEPGRFDSQVLPLPTLGQPMIVRVAHGRGRPPRHVRAVLVNVVADQGYLPGSEVDLSTCFTGAGTVLATLWADAAQLALASAGADWAPALYLRGGSGVGSITAANWNLKFYATW